MSPWPLDSMCQIVTNIRHAFHFLHPIKKLIMFHKGGINALKIKNPVYSHRDSHKWHADATYVDVPADCSVPISGHVLP